MPRLFVCLAIFCLVLFASLGCQSAVAAEPGQRPSGVRRAKPQKPAPAAVAPLKTGLFEALAGKRVMASFVPHDASVARISLVNVSSKPLEVSLPRVFAGAPVATLANVRPGGSYNLVGSSDSLSPQILGSVIPIPSGDAATPPAAPSVVLQPRQIRQFSVPCVCLQYGNPTPRPDVPYRLVSLETVSQSPQLRALLDEFSLGRLEQPVAQLAAWHFSNNLNWGELSETGFAPESLGEAAMLANLIETDVARQGSTSLSNTARQPKSAAKLPDAAVSQPSKTPPRRGSTNGPKNPGK